MWAEPPIRVQGAGCVIAQGPGLHRRARVRRRVPETVRVSCSSTCSAVPSPTVVSHGRSKGATRRQDRVRVGRRAERAGARGEGALPHGGYLVLIWHIRMFSLKHYLVTNGDRRARVILLHRARALRASYVRGAEDIHDERRHGARGVSVIPLQQLTILEGRSRPSSHLRKTDASLSDRVS